MKKNRFFFKLFRWEFWPFSVVYFPLAFYFGWLSLRARSFFFFTAANPAIEFGGMLGESKGKIFEQLPCQHIPVTRQFSADATLSDIQRWMQNCGLHFPILLKPDIGERGWMVRKVDSSEAAQAYLSEIKVSFLAQEYISLPLELGVFYYRFPGEVKGRISSITRKRFLEVEGDGRCTVRELLAQNNRARLYLKDLAKTYPGRLEYLPVQGEKVEIEPIGNHCRGTTFFDDSHAVTDRLEAVFDQIADLMPGFYFGRYDIRCGSYEELEEGRNFKILELNGAGAEPGHIYHPGRTIWAAYRDISHHMKVLFNIATENHRRGIPYMHFRCGWRFIRKIRAYNKQKVF